MGHAGLQFRGLLWKQYRELSARVDHPVNLVKAKKAGSNPARPLPPPQGGKITHYVQEVTPVKWLTVAQVMDLTGLSKEGVHKHIRSSKYQVREELGTPGYSGKRYLVALESLPYEAQAEWVRRLKKTIAHARQAAEEATEPSRPGLGTLAEIESKYTKEEWERIMFEALRQQEAVKRALDAMEICSWGQKGDALQAIADEYGVTKRTLQNWIKSYQDEGLEGLLDTRTRQQGPGTGNIKRRSIDSKAQAFMIALYLDEKQSTPAWCYDRTKTEAKAKGWKMCSRGTAYRIMAEIPRGVKEYARKGPKAWENLCMIKCVRDTENLQPMEVVMVDHHDCDIFVKYGNKAVRAWITLYLDVCSRCPVGWAFTVNPSSESLALGFRHMALPKPNFPFEGLPSYIYMDNGKDMKSKYFSGGKKPEFTQENRGILSDLDVGVLTAIPYWAWSKSEIERLFRTFADRFARHQVGWCGADYEERPEGFHKELQKLLKQNKLHTLGSLNAAFEEWLLTDYLTRMHSTLKCEPLDKYLSKEVARPGCIDADRLEQFLMKAESRVVTTQGIKWNDYYYYAPELRSLVADSEKRVTFRYDPANIGEIHVYYQGQKLCIATNKTLLRIGATSDHLAEHRKAQHEHKRITREAVYGHRKTLEELVAEDKQKGPHAINGTTNEKPKSAKVVALLPGSEPKPPAKKKKKGDLMNKYMNQVISEFEQEVTKGK